MAFDFGVLTKIAATAGAVVIAIAIFNGAENQGSSIWKTKRALPPAQGFEQGGETKSVVDAASINQRIVDEPFDAQSYVDGALLASSAGGDRLGEPIMKHALRLDPRNTAARALLFNLYLHQERFAEAVDEASVLYRLDPLVESPLSNTLAILSQLADVRAIIIKRFHETPFLSAILRAVPPNGLEERAMLEIADAVAPSAKVDAQAKILGEALGRGDYAAATRALRSFRSSSGESQALVHDGFFEGTVGPQPFTWSVIADDDVRAEMVQALPGSPSALSVERFSATPAVAARQTILLQAGNYRFSHLVKTGDQGSRAAPVAPFMWTITCPALAKPNLASLPINPKSSSAWAAVSWTIEVPSICKMIEIAFTSTPADENMAADLMITRVRLAPLGLTR